VELAEGGGIVKITNDSSCIGGSWLPSQGDHTFDVISPHTEQLVATVPEAGASGIDRAVGRQLGPEGLEAYLEAQTINPPRA
jgi:hypothetical protein